MTTPVAILFTRRDSVYKTLPGCDVWDIDRDALSWPGGSPVVAHPPCRAWGRLRHFARPLPNEKALALFAVQQVRQWGGVLEHPVGTQLWPVAGLPAPGKRDSIGWTLPVNQHWWGHRAKKATMLYVVGCPPVLVPAFPIDLSEPTHAITWSKRGKRSRLKRVCKWEIDSTPPAFAEWLVELARRCVAPVVPADGAQLERIAKLVAGVKVA